MSLEKSIKNLIALQEEIIKDSEKEMQKYKKREEFKLEQLEKRNLEPIQELLRRYSIEEQYNTRIEYYDGRKGNAELVIRVLKDAIEK